MSITVTPYAVVEDQAKKARDLMAAINPNAKTEYTVNEFGKKLCNGLDLDDCRHRCGLIDAMLSAAGLAKEAKIAHEIPLFVFAALSGEETLEFIRRWEETQP